MEIQYIPTGLPSLDAAGLLERGILTIVGGDPGAGKTAWNLMFLKSAAEWGYSPISFFFEDPLHFIADRITARSMGESAFKLRRIQLPGLDIQSRLGRVGESEDWTQHVLVNDDFKNSGQLLDWLDSNVTEATGLVTVDYAQAFDSEDNEKSVERVIARLAWGLNQLAKKKNVAVVLFSQLKTDVKDRGKKWYDNWRWNNKRDPGEADQDAVEGYRPISGDLQWSSALTQRAKQIIFIFRPGAWLCAHGVDAKDNHVDCVIAKGNYGPSNDFIRFGWDGPQTRIYEREKRKKEK